MRRVLGFLVALVALTAGSASAQRVCDINAPGRTENVGNQLIVFHDPFTVLCRDGAELRADGGRLNQAIRELQLNGNVFFRDSGRELTADEATYNSGTARLHARGNVRFENVEEGTVLIGPELEYFRETEERPQAQVLAPQRPTLTLRADPEDPDAEPMDLVADRVMILGEDDLNAFGSVVITRTDMRATSSEARYQSSLESLELRQQAHITSDEYDLEAEVIQVNLADGSLEMVHARTDAILTGSDARVTAPDLQLFFQSDTLRQAVAQRDTTTGSRALARSSEFELTADSIQADFLDQQINEVHSVGSARAVSVDSTQALNPVEPDSLATPADTLNPASEGGASLDRGGILAHDWIEGDTIIAYFEAVPVAEDSIPGPVPPDSATTEVEMRRLVAMGGAKSLYRMTPEGGQPSDRPNINFLVGDRIELELQDQELSVANVAGLRRGIYMEATQAPQPGVSPAQPPPTDSRETVAPPSPSPDSAQIQ